MGAGTVRFGYTPRDSAAERRGWSYSLTQPRELLSTHSLREVLPLLEHAEAEAARGAWVAVALSFESAPAFDPAYQVKQGSASPLCWVGIYDALAPEGAAPAAPIEPLPPLGPTITADEYTRDFQAVIAAIQRGDIYQLNYTFPLRASIDDAALALEAHYEALAALQGAPYAAYFNLGSEEILSFSPELFFERQGNLITTRPMKGTAPRGRWPEEDSANSIALRESEKNRGENVMIVDLLRNDLSRIACSGSVQAASLFDVERYHRVWQMTSTVTANLPPETTTTQILRALFPCGSITGAPKIRALELIAEHERAPRGFYTGALGIILPGGDSVFNVAIRTLVKRREESHASFFVGSGVTFSSRSEEEFAECLQKGAFLSDARGEFALIETLRLEEGTFPLLRRHLARITTSAEYFGRSLEVPVIEAKLSQAAAHYPHGSFKVRLLYWPDHRCQIEVSPLPPQKVFQIALAKNPLNTLDLFLFHKTTIRTQYDQERIATADDTIYWNEAGELTESSIGNLVLRIDDQLLTPPRSSGLLCGTFREELLSRGEIKEASIPVARLFDSPVWIINSVRGWVETTLLPPTSTTEPPKETSRHCSHRKGSD